MSYRRTLYVGAAIALASTIHFNTYSQIAEVSSMHEPPIAERRPHTATHHGLTVQDPYHWLKDQSYPEVDDEDVLTYLRQENAYFEQFMAPLQDNVEELFEELKARQVEDESSVPVRDGPFVYQTRYVPNSQYQLHVRWPASENADDDLNPPEDNVEVLINENALAEGKSYFSRRGFALNHDHQLLAFGIDDSGAERYVLRILNLTTGEYLPETMEDATGDVVWSSDGQTLFYVVYNENWRPFRVLRHRLGSNPADDEVIFEEEDDGFFVDMWQSTSRKYLIVSTASGVTSEVHVLALDKPDEALSIVEPRSDQHEYDLDHHRDRWVIRSNDEHKNFRIAVAPEAQPAQANWDTLIPGSDARYLLQAVSFESHIVLQARDNGLRSLHILDADDQLRTIDFDEAAYNVHLGANREADPTFLRIVYSSLTTPNTTYDYEFETGELQTRKVQQIPSGHEPSEYATERIFAKARDGVDVPVSLVYRQGTPRDGSAPLYLYAYGAYGSSSDPYFRSSILSLLNRGFIFGIAHIRGGSELGYAWYEGGKLAERTNTFNDFVDVARHLIAEKYTAKGRLAIVGGSAGGSLMGAVVNQAPDLWGAVAAHVPFVDILNTMLDDSLPLTPIEWPEWGNPITSKADFEFIQSYSPYDQLKPMAYPPMLVTAGINDPRVTYWEPAKWVAKIRHLKKDNNPLILRTEMSSGHGGKSGRYDSLRELAEEFAFVLNVMGVAPSTP